MGNRITYSEDIERHNAPDAAHALADCETASDTWTYFDEPVEARAAPGGRLTEGQLGLLADLFREFLRLPEGSYDRKIVSTIVLERPDSTAELARLTGIRRDYMYRVYRRLVKSCPAFASILPCGREVTPEPVCGHERTRTSEDGEAEPAAVAG